MALSTCFTAFINHDIQDHMTLFNMVSLFVATLSYLHRDAPAADALGILPYMHQPTIAMRQ
jgi:hypothetical protein